MPQLVFASTVPTPPFTVAVEWQLVHRSVEPAGGSTVGAVAPSVETGFGVVSTFAKSSVRFTWVTASTA